MDYNFTNIYAGTARGQCQEFGCSCPSYRTLSAQPGHCATCGHGPLSHLAVGMDVSAPPPPPPSLFAQPSALMGVTFGGATAPPPPPPPSTPFGGLPRVFQVNIDWNKLRPVELIGQGSFGYVHKAFFDRTPVAVKMLYQQTHDPELVNLFNRELAIVREIRHPNILQYLYHHDIAPHMMIMTELMPGSLRSLLANVQVPFETPAVVKVALGISRAMSFLHSMTPPVLHRDLKSTHVLLDSGYNAKITGFGMTKVKDYSTKATGRFQNRKLNWQAPEVMEGQAASQASDVYSFGMVVWEMISRQEPFAQFDNNILIAQAVLRGERPPIPTWCHPELARMITGTWQQMPQQRPTFEYIVDFLERTFGPVS